MGFGGRYKNYQSLMKKRKMYSSLDVNIPKKKTEMPTAGLFREASSKNLNNQIRAINHVQNGIRVSKRAPKRLK
jgi:hypothetical protein